MILGSVGQRSRSQFLKIELNAPKYDQIMLISDLGTLVRTSIEEVSVLGRNTQGVRLINLRSGERLIGVARIVEQEEDELPDSE